MRFLAGKLSPDGNTFALGLGKDVHLYEVPSWKLKQKLSGHKHVVTAIGFSRDGNLVASGSLDSTAFVWKSPDKPADAAK